MLCGGRKNKRDRAELSLEEMLVCCRKTKVKNVLTYRFLKVDWRYLIIFIIIKTTMYIRHPYMISCLEAKMAICIWDSHGNTWNTGGFGLSFGCNDEGRSSGGFNIILASQVQQYLGTLKFSHLQPQNTHILVGKQKWLSRKTTHLFPSNLLATKASEAFSRRGETFWKAAQKMSHDQTW